MEKDEYEWRAEQTEADTEKERVRDVLRNALYWFKVRGNVEHIDATVDELIRQLGI